MDLGKLIKTYLPILILFLGIVLELGFQTLWIKDYGVYISPIVWFAGGLITCFAAYYLVAFKKTTVPVSRDYYKRYNNGLLVFSVSVFGSIVIAMMLSRIYKDFPVDPMASDIIPSLEAYVQRLLTGEKVYAPIPFPGWTVNPTYLPLLWFPYTFSELLNLDYRWTAYLVFIIAVWLYNLKLVRHDIPYWEATLKALLPFLFLLAYVTQVEKVFGHAVELLPAGFYLILTLTVFNRSRLLMVVGIVLCLMSRYAFTFWLPVYLIVIWVEWGFREVFKIGLGVLAGVLIVYVFPFLLKDPTIFTKGLEYYSLTAESQWVTQHWQAEGDKPFHLFQGLSFAAFFYDFVDGDVMHRMATNRLVHISVCALTAFLIGLFYFMNRKKGLNTTIYLIISLKLYLVVFYAFFYVPFSYLYMLPFFLTIAIIYQVPFHRKIE